MRGGARWTDGARFGTDSELCPDREICVRMDIKSSTSDGKRGVLVQVVVRDNNVDQALKALKKKMRAKVCFAK